MNQKVICCWGDSITEGAWMLPGESYPAFLQQELGEDYFVLNGGSGGERTETIMARAGAHRVFLKQALHFPAGVAEIPLGTAEDNQLRTEWDETLRLTLYLGRDLPINPLTINGERYAVRYVNWGWNPISGELRIAREEWENESTVEAGSEVFFHSLKQSALADFHVFYMGTNGKYTDNDDLFRQQEAMAKHFGKNFLMITPHFLPDWDEKYAFAFGEAHTLSMRAWLCSEEAFRLAGVQPTEADREYLSRGAIPPVFTYSPGNCHLNALGYRILAIGVARKLRELI